MPRLRLIAGPNGSGKTTLTKELRDFYHLNMGVYINPDDIAQTDFFRITDPVNQAKEAQRGW